jgi:hypothetical protein
MTARLFTAALTSAGLALAAGALFSRLFPPALAAVVAVVVALAGAAGIARWLSAGFAPRVAEILEVARQYRAGAEGPLAPPSYGNDEFGVVAHAFDDAMQASRRRVDGFSC